jgi:hypothetical protein
VTGLDRVVATVEDAHRTMTLAYGMSKVSLAAGKPVRIQVAEHEDDRSLRANAYYWGCVLPAISAQAKLDGQRWTVDAWHELAKRQFLGYEVKKLVVAGKKRKLVIRQLRSTSGLKVKAFSVFLDRLQAFAATDLGVRFPVADWQHWAGLEQLEDA